jgi:RNA polymerase sigma-70 factor (family 1)
MNEQMKELLLIEQGNEQAFDNFMTRHSQRLYNYAYGILCSKELTREVISDVFLEVWNRRKKLAEIEKIDHWLTTVTYHKAVSVLRKEMKHKEDVSLDNALGFDFPQMVSPIDSLISKEDWSRLNHAISELPKKCKHVFYLAKIEQMPYSEIAKMLQISVPTVNYHVGFAMASLKKALKY